MRVAFLRRHGGELIASAVVLCFYVVALRQIPLDVFWHPDEGGKFLALETFHWDNGLRYEVAYAGRSVDPEFRFYPGNCERGRLYPTPGADGGVQFHWSIWFPLLSRFFFDLFGMAGIYVVPLVSGWLTAIVAGRLAAFYDAALAPAAILVVGCATPLVFYSLSFLEHTLATLLGTLATAIMLSSRPGRRSALWWAGACVFLAVALRIEMVAFGAALAGAWAFSQLAERGVDDGPVLRRPRTRTFSVLLMSGVVISGLVLVGVLAPRQRALVLAVPHLLNRVRVKVPYLMDNVVAVFVGWPPGQGLLKGSLWQSAMFLALSAVPAAALVRSRRMETVLILGALLLLFESSLVMVLSSPAYFARQGVLVVAPYMVAGVYALRHAWGRRDVRLMRLAGAAACYAALGFLTLFGARTSEEGIYLIGLDGSARYMLTLYPLGAVLSLVAVRMYWASDRALSVKSAFTALVAAMVIVSFAYQLRGLQMVHGRREVLKSWEGVFRQQERVVSDVWWLAAALAPFFTTHEMYCVNRPGAVSDWIEATANRSITSFTFASLNPVDSLQFGPKAAEILPTESGMVEGMYVYGYRVIAQDAADQRWVTPQSWWRWRAQGGE